MQELTQRQSQVLEMARQYKRQHGYPPTRAEISAHFGFKSANAAEVLLRTLDRKGFIRLIRGVSRGIHLTEPNSLPLIGRVRAGAPILAEEHVEDQIELAANFFNPQAHFLLQVIGDSMINAAILDGDLLAVHKTSEAWNGQIVVARLNDEVTVKRLRRGRSRRYLSLMPENPAYDPIEVDLRHGDFAIEGLGVGVLRRT